MDGNNNPELNMYDVECDNINDMLLKKEELVKERVPVNVMNDTNERMKHINNDDFLTINTILLRLKKQEE